MEFLYAINQSLFLFINADHDDHPGAIVMALLIAEYLTAITLVAVAVYLVWKHRRRRVVWLNVLCSLLLGMAATYLIRKGWHVPRPFDMQLAKWHEDGSGVDETIEALTGVLALLAYHRENVKKAETPELMFGDDDE